MSPLSSARGEEAAQNDTLNTASVSGTFYPNPSNSGAFDPSQLTSPVFTQSFPVIDFNPPTGAAVQCSVPTGVTDHTRPFTDVIPNDGTCTTEVAEGNGSEAGVSPLFMFEAVFETSIAVSGPGEATFDFFSDDGWILGVGPVEGGTAQPTYVSGELYNPPPSSPAEGFDVVGAYNRPSAPKKEQVTVDFPAAGTYPMEVDYTECCGGTLSLVLNIVRAIGTCSQPFSPIDPTTLPDVVDDNVLNPSSEEADYWGYDVSSTFSISDTVGVVLPATGSYTIDPVATTSPDLDYDISGCWGSGGAMVFAEPGLYTFVGLRSSHDAAVEQGKLPPPPPTNIYRPMLPGGANRVAPHTVPPPAVNFTPWIDPSKVSASPRFVQANDYFTKWAATFNPDISAYAVPPTPPYQAVEVSSNTNLPGTTTPDGYIMAARNILNAQMPCPPCSVNMAYNPVGAGANAPVTDIVNDMKAAYTANGNKPIAAAEVGHGMPSHWENYGSKAGNSSFWTKAPKKKGDPPDVSPDLKTLEDGVTANGTTNEVSSVALYSCYVASGVIKTGTPNPNNVMVQLATSLLAGAKSTTVSVTGFNVPVYAIFNPKNANQQNFYLFSAASTGQKGYFNADRGVQVTVTASNDADAKTTVTVTAKVIVGPWFVNPANPMGPPIQTIDATANGVTI